MDAARHHEVGQRAGQRRDQIVTFRAGPRPCHQMDRLPQLRIRQAQRHGFGHKASADGSFFDFLRADTVAAGLDHRIAAADKMEQALGIAAHAVTRPYGQAAKLRKRRRGTKAFGCAFGVLPVPLRHQRPAMDQFALFIGRSGLPGIVDNENLGKRNGAADGCRMPVHQHGIEIGRAERFGQAVHRIEVRLRESGPQGPYQVRGQRPSAVGQAAQRSCGLFRPVQFRQLQPQRRDSGDRCHTMAGHGFHHIARCQVIERDHRAACVPCRQQLVLAIIERQRQHRQHAVVGRDPEVVGNADRTQPKVRLAKHHALGPPGGTAGVKNGSKAVWRGIGRRQHRTQRLGLRPRDRLFDCRADGIGRLQRIEPRLARYQQRRAAIGKDMRNLPALEQRVDGYVHQPCSHRCQRHEASHFGFRQPGGDPRARMRHARFQPACQQAYTRV